MHFMHFTEHLCIFTYKYQT